MGGDLFISFFSKLNEYLFHIYGPVTQSFSGMAHVLVVLYVVIMGYMSFTGRFGEASKSALISIPIIAIVFGIMFDEGLFKEWIYSPIVSLSYGLTSFIMQGGTDSSLSGIFKTADEVFGKLYEGVKTVYRETDGLNFLTDMSLIVEAFLVSLGISALYGVVYLVFTILMIAGAFGLTVLFVLGGIAGVCGAFPFTRHIFWAWLRSVMNYALIPVFTGIIMSIALFAIQGVSADMAAINPTATAGSLLFSRPVGQAFLIGGLTLYFLLKAPEFAATLTGGVSSGLGGLVGAAAGVAAGGAGRLGRAAIAVQQPISRAATLAAKSASERLSRLTSGRG